MKPVVALAVFVLTLLIPWLWDRVMKGQEHRTPLVSYVTALLAAFVLIHTDPLEAGLMKLPPVSATGVVVVVGLLLLAVSHLVARRILSQPVAVVSPLQAAPDSTPPPLPARPAIAVTAEGPYVVVRNSGAPAIFRAHLVATHAQQFPTVTEGSHFEAIWETTLNDRAEIATGDADRLLIGAVSGDHDPNMAPFHFYDVATGKMGVRYAHQKSQGSVPALSMDLTLVSVPALPGGPMTFEFLLVQGRVEWVQDKPM